MKYRWHLRLPRFRIQKSLNSMGCSMGQPTDLTARDVSPVRNKQPSAVGEFGRVIRINIHEHNRRIFTPTPYGSPSWRRGYNRRSVLERINNRIDDNFGFENHFIRGNSNMTARVGLALAVIMALALGHVKEGREEQIRSLVRPIPIAASG